MNLWRKINKRLKIKCRSSQNELLIKQFFIPSEAKIRMMINFYANDAVMIAME